MLLSTTASTIAALWLVAAAYTTSSPPFPGQPAPSRLHTCAGCNHDSKDITLWKCTLSKATSLLKIRIPIWFQSGNEVVLASVHSSPEAASKDLEQYEVRNCTIFSKMADIAQYEEIKEARVKRQTQNSSSWHQRYHEYTEIRDWFQGLALKHPNLVKFVPNIGQTHQLVPMFAVHITNNTHNGTSEKKKFYIQCLIHAREWISGSVCQCLADFLVQKQAKKVVSALLEKLEYVFVPVANPDGYKLYSTFAGYMASILKCQETIYCGRSPSLSFPDTQVYPHVLSKGKLTWSQYPLYRFWRKNLAYHGPLLCGGVDLNRNFPKFWEHNHIHCSHLFSGPKAQSEPEVQAIIRYISSIKPVVAAIDFHSYQQLVLTPYSGSNSTPPNNATLFKYARRIARVISEVNSVNYSVIQGSDWYIAKGTFVDWLYSDEVSANNTDSNGVAYRVIPLNIELRPRRSIDQLNLDGFLLPTKEILPVCHEVFKGVKTFSKAVARKPLKYKK